MQAFTYAPMAQRVVFGARSLQQLPAEIDLLGARRVLVLSTPGQRALAERVMALLGERVAGLFDQARMHVPLDTVLAARAQASALGADCTLAIGGGSTTGLAKALALEPGLPIVALPCTYAGSEVTSIYGITDQGIKKTGRDARVLPRTVVYDPELTLGLPGPLSVVSGINAIAHAAEGLYAPDANPVMEWMARTGIAALGRALPKFSHPGGAMGTDPDAILAARSEALYGAWLCGTVLGNVAMGLHHKLCHTLGGSFDLPHAPTHTIVLPHALAYNAAAAPKAMAAIAQALGRPHASGAQAVYDLARDNGAPVALRDLGLPQSALDRACELALQNQYANPRPLEARALRSLLQDAFDGRRPD